MSGATPPEPDENSTLEAWKAWVHDHEDIHFREVTVDARVFLAIVSQRDSEHDRAERILKLWDDDGQRL